MLGVRQGVLGCGLWWVAPGGQGRAALVGVKGSRPEAMYTSWLQVGQSLGRALRVADGQCWLDRVRG